VAHAIPAYRVKALGKFEVGQGPRVQSVGV
jgi:hypothetical protein